MEYAYAVVDRLYKCVLYKVYLNVHVARQRTMYTLYVVRSRTWSCRTSCHTWSTAFITV